MISICGCCKYQCSDIFWTRVYTISEPVNVVSTYTTLQLRANRLQDVFQQCRSSGRDAFVVGCANVGKSSLINCILGAGNDDRKV